MIAIVQQSCRMFQLLSLMQLFQMLQTDCLMLKRPALMLLPATGTPNLLSV
jgi:hypothetical protein